MPQHKQAMTPSLWSRIEGREGQQLPGRVAPWSPATRWRDRILLRLGRVQWHAGHRLGEIVSHPSGEINYLTRSCVTISKADKTLITVPTTQDWQRQRLKAGEMLFAWLLDPPRPIPLAWCTPFGLVHSPFPSLLPHDGSNTSAAAAVRDIEIEKPCLPSARKTTPLFGDENNRPFTYSVLHRELRKVLTALLGARAASLYSWHSLRSGLACALQS
uniref:Tyr recombinase domain-containing protein n=1 Tax=Haptolina brevifila TaxID=156173 RepID=A0A7S2GTD0_9EUKA|mmetsp:Transcript_47754/g.95333  ORF Transcript_47754/g.95333 Transcript_47754/m.95333 type:complete len:216 (+) Transcript_47754:305-952(+)